MKYEQTLKQLIIPSILMTSLSAVSVAQAADPSHLEMAHNKGTFMIDVAAMRMNMDGLRSGTDDVNTADATNMMGSYKNMMVPTEMTMDMFMLMPMYNFSKDLSGMLMVNYIDNSMEMTNGAGNCTSTMETSGLGDTQASLSYKFMDDYFAASMEVSLPTGSIDEKTTMNMMMNGMCMEMDMFSPYAMQLGSGTYDVTPSLTYLGAYFSLRYGAQVSYKYRIGENDNGYTLGNEAKTKLWVRKPVSMVTLSAELDFKRWGDIEGVDTKVPTTMPSGMKGSPTAFTSNYGGTKADFTVGAEVPVAMAAVGLGVTFPIYQDLNGLQMKHNWSAALSVSAMY